jgi:hypothetical protein
MTSCAGVLQVFCTCTNAKFPVSNGYRIYTKENQRKQANEDKETRKAKKKFERLSQLSQK